MIENFFGSKNWNEI